MTPTIAPQLADLPHVPIGELQPFQGDLKELSAREYRKLRKSLIENGVIVPFFVWEETGALLDGHQRRRVFDNEGWSMPVPVVYISADDEQDAKRKLLVISSQYGRVTQEGWDEFTFDIDDDWLRDTAQFDALPFVFGDLPDDEQNSEDAEPQIDRAEELRELWGVEPGQMWRLPSRTAGQEHRLICGDSSGAGEGFSSVVIDPEWDDVYPRINGAVDALVFFDGNHWGDVIGEYGAPRWVFVWNCGTSWYVPGKPLLRGKFAAWYGDGEYVQDGYRFGRSMVPAGRVVNSRGRVDYTPHKDGVMLSDVYNRGIVAEHSDGLHSHSKPVDWVTAMIANCTKGAVFDGFAGSGTTMIAAEKLGRESELWEIRPGMCAVILQRYYDEFGIRGERDGNPKI